MNSELEGHAATGAISDETTPQGVNPVSSKWVLAWKTDVRNGFITKAKARLLW